MDYHRTSIGYFAYRTLSFEGSVQSVIESWDTWTNLAFIIFLNLTVQTGAIDSGISNGLESEEFKLSDAANNKFAYTNTLNIVLNVFIVLTTP